VDIQLSSEESTWNQAVATFQAATCSTHGFARGFDSSADSRTVLTVWRGTNDRLEMIASMQGLTHRS
jgi:hypothetical protein